MNTETMNALAIPAEALSGQEMTILPTSTAIETRDGIITAQRVAVERNDAKILAKIKALAAAAGDNWYYRWPTKSNGKTSYVEGPSVKCATAIARLYGNCQVDIRVVDGPTHITFYARFVDYETGFSLTRPFQQRKNQRAGDRMDADRQADLTFQIGASKATRNVICNALELFTEFAFEQAKNSLVNDIGKNLEGSRKKILANFAELKIDVKRVERIYGKAHTEWLAPDIAKMVAEVRSINDGFASKDETYPPSDEEAQQHVAQVQAAEQKQPAQPVQAQAATTETKPEQQSLNVGEAQSDWNAVYDELAPGVLSAKSVAELDAFLDENAGLIGDMSKSAPRTLVATWIGLVNERRKAIK